MTIKTSAEAVDSVIVEGFTYHTGEGMTVTLKDGKVYHYPTATAEHFAEMLVAESKGAYFAKTIAKLPSSRVK